MNVWSGSSGGHSEICARPKSVESKDVVLDSWLMLGSALLLHVSLWPFKCHILFFVLPFTIRERKPSMEASQWKEL